VPHFARAGVPIGSLPTTIFLAAALSFSFITGSSLICGVALRAIVDSESGAKRKVVRVAVFVVPTFICLWLIFQNWRIIAYSMLVALCMSLAGWPGRQRQEHGGHPLHLAVHSFAWYASIVAPALLFGWLAFPAIPVELGGGRPRVLAIIPGELLEEVSEQQSKLTGACDTAISMFAQQPATATWPHGLCTNPRPSAGRKALERRFCRTVYRMHDDSEFMYLAVNDACGECPDVPQWRPWDLEVNERAVCFARISNSIVTSLDLGVYQRVRGWPSFASTPGQ
jgi:hypothetical protein